MLKGGTANRWTQMITVTGAKGLVGNANLNAMPETFAGSIVGGFRSACPESFATQGFGPTKFGDQDACGGGKLRQRRERQAWRNRADCRRERPGRLLNAAMGRTHAGGRKTRHRRGQMGLDRLRRLQPIRFCPIVPGEAALYPSCAVKG